MILEIRKELIEISETEFKKFTANLIPGAENILGIRMPVLREMSKKIAVDEKWKEYVLYEDMKYYEEFMLQGMIIGLKKKEDIEEILKLTEKFILRINNWAVCDTFCTDLKIVKKNKERVWKFLERYFLSEKEYDIRFAAVLSLKYFVDEEYLERMFLYFDNLKNHKYYVQMAVAWAVAEIYIKYPERTLEYINNNKLDNFTHNKSIQKICESFRVNKKTKEKLKLLKR